ncbi:MAG: 4Fe-4S cluster-binding domain-containing protein [Candidatus Lokiarchaeota archaeon]
MKNNNVLKSSGDSFFIKGRGIPKGCEFCLKGAKTVLFLNGICQLPDHCSWYCPISKKRKGKNQSYANEHEISSNKELLEEIRTTNSKGMSITGGEPLSKYNLNKTIEFIRYIKSELGAPFHIHLYTNALNFSDTVAQSLDKVGLDEIRFHPPRDKWKIMKFALDTNMSVGAEVPVIPQKEYLSSLKEFILYLDSIGAEFINLNEFEYCFPNSETLKERGFTLKKGTIASVENSKESAMNLIKNVLSYTSLKIHFCRIITKDYFQLKNRYLRRAKNVKKPYEEITEEGLLLYAEITGNLENLLKFNRYLIKIAQVPLEFVHMDKEILIIPYYIALEEEVGFLLKKYNLKTFIIETTPFQDPKYRQITEKTPLKIFKEEYEFYES